MTLVLDLNSIEETARRFKSAAVAAWSQKVGNAWSSMTVDQKRAVSAGAVVSLMALAAAAGWYGPEIHERFIMSDAEFCSHAVNYADDRCWGKGYPLRNP